MLEKIRHGLGCDEAWAPPLKVLPVSKTLEDGGLAPTVPSWDVPKVSVKEYTGSQDQRSTPLFGRPQRGLGTTRDA